MAVDAVVNWLWQGSLVALAAAAMLHVIGPARANARYILLWIAWLSVLAVLIAPLVWVAAPSADSGPVQAVTMATGMVSIPLDGLWSSALLALCGVWSAVFGVRIVLAMVALRSARTGCHPLPHDRETRLRCWTRVGTTGRRTRVVVSSSVRSAAVLGNGSPLIAIAPALLETLDDDELDRVVIHEWAHVQRYDDIAHLIQVIGRATAGWHPALWWIDRQLHLEREVACDETVVSITGSVKGYASCLTKLASLPVPPVRSLTAVGVLSSYGLRARIVRILRFGHDAAHPMTWRRLCLAGTALCVIALGVSTTRLVDTSIPAQDLTRVAGPPAPGGDATPDHDGHRAAAPVAVASHGSPRPPAAGPTTSTRANRGARTPAGQQNSEPAMDAAPPPLASKSLEGASLLTTASRSNLTGSTDLSNGEDVPDVLPQPDSDNTIPPGSPWNLAADAGKAVGRMSRDKAVATAGFFTRFGRSVARSF
jgi:beta-lactamase regulating signal transducer with metallopeptidase domain